MRWLASIIQAGVLPIAVAIRSIHQKHAATDISGRSRTSPHKTLMECSCQQLPMRRNGQRFNVAEPLAATTPRHVLPVPAEWASAGWALGNENASMLHANGNRPEGPQQTLVGNLVLPQTSGADRPRGREVTQQRLGIENLRWLLISWYKYQGRRVMVDRQGRKCLGRLMNQGGQIVADSAGHELVQMRRQPAALGQDSNHAADTLVPHGLGGTPDKTQQ